MNALPSSSPLNENSPLVASLEPCPDDDRMSSFCVGAAGPSSRIAQLFSGLSCLLAGPVSRLGTPVMTAGVFIHW